MTEETLLAPDGFKISFLYAPAKDPIAVAQLVHGSLEHKERYLPLIDYLNKNHISCGIIDLRGHGKSVSDDYPAGYMKSVSEIISDLFLETKELKNRNPNLKLFMIGHSLGSIFARVYLQKHDSELSGLILSGTANPRLGASLGPVLVSALSLFVGGKYGRFKIFNKIAGLNKPYEEWLSYSKENIRKHAEDKANCPMFLNGGFKVLFDADAELSRKRKYRCLNPLLPIMSVTGEDDPVTGGPEGLRKSFKTLKSIGYENFDIKVYSHMMHEVFNEDDKETVYRDIVWFIKENI